MLLSPDLQEVRIFPITVTPVESKSCFLSLLVQKVTFYGSSLVENGPSANGQPLEIQGASRPAIVTKAGLVLFGTDGKTV